jgi:single-strand DNA-binding protein
MASDINHVVLVGRLTRDAELKYISTGTAVARLSIACNRRKRSGDQWADEVSYFDVVLWGKTAESLTKYLTKGTQIAVEGELRQNRWEQDGQSRSKVEVVANNIELLGSPRGGQRPSSDAPDVPSGKESSGPDTFEDDIPF